MSPEAAAASFHLPEGFSATVFASEPEVRQPIAMAFDLKGRLWVAENYTYAEAGVNFATNLMDRVLILEDADGDGHAESRKVFWDRAQILTSVEPTPDGAYILCPPRLLFLPDRNHDDIPDGEPEVILDGFITTTGNRHTFANGLKWGPDGWLWGRIGISSGAKIGVPGQPEAQRVEMRGGIWRYHPGRRVVEAVSHGTTNPWGLDWDAVGEPFFINTVIGHLWHAIPGAHFERMHGDDVMTRSYALISQHADHLHFDAGSGWTKSRAAADGSPAAGSDSLGGGHAHTGLLIYQGTNWPSSYRDGLFTWNLHGRRMNRERLERRGSGYVGRHEPDLLQVEDPWFRGIDVIQGPEGGVYIADWSDTGECHEHDGVHRSSGRIFRITHGRPGRLPLPDFTRSSVLDLARLALDPNEWVSRAARKALSFQAGTAEVAKVTDFLESVVRDDGSDHRSLRALWALNALCQASPDRLLGMMRSKNEHLRSWAVRMLAEGMEVNPEAGPVRSNYKPALQKQVVARWMEMAREDSSPRVRLYLGSALQRLPATERATMAAALVGHGEDASDHNIGLMLWYAVEPLGDALPEGLVHVAEVSRIPVVRRYAARRLAEDIASRPVPVALLMDWAAHQDESAQMDCILGISEALRGVRRVNPPASWKALSASAARSGRPPLARMALELDVVFGDGRAVEDLRRVALDTRADVLSRRAAVRALVESRTEGLAPLLRELADDGALRMTALQALVELGDPVGPDMALKRYLWLGLEERVDLVSALASRPESARVLLEALARGQLTRTEITPFQAGQIARLNDPVVQRFLAEHWGTVKIGGSERKADIARWKERLSASELAKANLSQGRRTFAQLCAGCHRLYGEGGEVGPDLTGSGRSSIEYLLENVVDPNAVVAADQRLAVVHLKDGRVLSGLLRDANERGFTIVGPSERTLVLRSEVSTLEKLEQSVMPEGLLESVSVADALNLVAYLMHPRQVSLEGTSP